MSSLKEVGVNNLVTRVSNRITMLPHNEPMISKKDNEMHFNSHSVQAKLRSMLVLTAYIAQNR